ncbi:MAG TPA: hypothetical protein VFL91_30530 [Thermomicrobiales bacterium]|nr:hypothetical protein [Thermomicrobiales bacterium]
MSVETPASRLTPTQRRRARTQIARWILAAGLSPAGARRINRTTGWSVDLRAHGGPRLDGYRLVRGELAVISNLIQSWTEEDWTLRDAAREADHGR